MRALAARRVRRLVAAFSLAVAVALVAAVAFHVELAQGQLRLDDARQELAAEQERYETERFETAAAAAPAEILERAKALGMVEPSEVMFISTRPGTAPVEGPDRDAPTSTLVDWGDVKPHLGTTQP